ncbi:MAG TPA: glycosyltransferase [Phycisphaerae bacterium]|nr:glycosyltransferase [Phycisphaerae bacterium]
MSAELVTLVIPGRNAARTIRTCLDAVVPLLNQDGSRLAEIIFVNDGSTDDTASIVATYPVRCLTGPGGGPGAARNIGWKAAAHPLVWFIDSDCVAQPDALSLLLPHLDDSKVGGAGGSYGNMCPDSLLACLIHEEIIQRHRSMPAEVNFLGGFNVLYRKAILEQVGGFDEHRYNGPGSPGAEDAELAYRVHEAGHLLRFEPRSIVRHFHPTRLTRYLRAQRHHGYWRVFLHMRHRSKAAGDAYSDLIDHAQPAVAMLTLASLVFLFIPGLNRLPHLLAIILLLMQFPRTIRLTTATQQAKYLWYAPFGFLRAFWRGIGMTQGVLAYFFAGVR